jgi:nucleoside triphosphate pyrophosphatase
MKIHLASKSPRRQELLKQIGIDFDLLDIDIDESWDGKEAPEDYVRRVAIEKARVGYTLINDNLPVLAADTAVVLDDHILGKAENKDDARAMLNRLSGETHTVLSAVTVITNHEHTKVNISTVTFKDLSKQEIDEYCSTDEPIGKAGGYAIQGRAAIFIQQLEGSYSGVMGLPLFETQQLLNAE